MTFSFILSFELAYLIGAIPFSVLAGKLFFGKDVRKEGSKNPGATNTFRVLGVRAGLSVLILDIAKGMIAVSLSYYFGNIMITDTSFVLYQLGLGLTATLGHIYPIYLWFKGGKGVATMYGVVIAVFPMAALICTGVFLLLFIVTRYVSLSSIVTSVVFPVVVIFYLHHQEIPVVIFSLLIPALIIYTHRENIKRLIEGKESKVSFRRKPKFKP